MSYCPTKMCLNSTIHANRCGRNLFFSLIVYLAKFECKYRVLCCSECVDFDKSYKPYEIPMVSDPESEPETEASIK